MFIGYYNSWPDYDIVMDHIYAGLCKLKRPFFRIPQHDVDRIREIEASVYPEDMQGYTNLVKAKQLLRKLNCYSISQIDYVVQDGMYILCTVHYNCVYINDIACEKQSSSLMFKMFKEKLAQYFLMKKPVFAEARETTSYVMFKFYERKGYISIEEDEVIELGGEPFHRVKVNATEKLVQMMK